MKHEITLEQAADHVEEIHVLMLMLFRCADTLEFSEIQAVTRVAAGLAGKVTLRLYADEKIQGGK